MAGRLAVVWERDTLTTPDFFGPRGVGCVDASGASKGSAPELGSSGQKRIGTWKFYNPNDVPTKWEAFVWLWPESQCDGEGQSQGPCFRGENCSNFGISWIHACFSQRFTLTQSTQQIGKGSRRWHVTWIVVDTWRMSSRSVSLTLRRCIARTPL